MGGGSAAPVISTYAGSDPHPPTLGRVSSLVTVLHYRQSAHHGHFNMTPFTSNHTLTFYFVYLEFKDLHIIFE